MTPFLVNEKKNSFHLLFPTKYRLFTNSFTQFIFEMMPLFVTVRRMKI